MRIDVKEYLSSLTRRSDPIFIMGPCQIESEKDALTQAEHLVEATQDLPITLVFKASYDKANRTSLSGGRGPGMEQGLHILGKIREQFEVPVLTDIHLPDQAQTVADVVDILQIPAFLCRQTDLLLAAGATGKPVNIKKGQFLHPLDILKAAEKITSAGSQQILLCERGSSFGYRDLVVDMRSYTFLKEAMNKSSLSYPLIFDATHSTQNIGGAGGVSSGNWKLALPLALSSIAAGAQGIFAECHTDPMSASSDKEAMIPMASLRSFVESCLEVFSAMSRIETSLQQSEGD